MQAPGFRFCREKLQTDRKYADYGAITTFFCEKFTQPPNIVILIPNSIIDGGITGLSIMGAYLTGLPLGLFLVLLNLPFLLMGYRSIGKTFALSTLLGIIVLSVTATLLHPVQEFTRDTLLASVFGGILLGVGVGIVIRFGGSLDGTEMIAVMLNRKSPFSVGRLLCF